MPRHIRLALILLLFVVWGVISFNIGFNEGQEEYEVIVVTTTMDVQPLIDAGYIEKSGYIFEEEDWVNRWPVKPCPICEGIQSGEITPTSWLEESDNFTVMMQEGAYDWDKPTIKFYPNNTHNIEVKIIISEE